MFDFIKKLLKKTSKGRPNKRSCPAPNVKKATACKNECPIKREEKQAPAVTECKCSEAPVKKEAVSVADECKAEAAVEEKEVEAAVTQTLENMADSKVEDATADIVPEPEYVIKLAGEDIYSFELVGADGKTIVKSCDYTLKRSCVSGIQSVRKNGSTENLEDRSEENYTKSPNPKYELTVDENSKYRFSLKAPNGYIILTSQAYNAKRTCMRAINAVRKNSMTDRINDMTK